jgi:hypothetical protein
MVGFELVRENVHPPSREASMKWERPELFEIGMNAEIGGYQSDFEGGERPGPRSPTAEATSVASSGEPGTHAAS